MSGPQPHIVIYSSPLCAYCASAKRLLRRKDVDFEEINVLFNAERRREMEQRSARRTVPQIFIGDKHVGGSDDLHALDASGELDTLLGLQAS